MLPALITACGIYAEWLLAQSLRARQRGSAEQADKLLLQAWLAYDGG